MAARLFCVSAVLQKEINERPNPNRDGEMMCDIEVNIDGGVIMASDEAEARKIVHERLIEAHGADTVEKCLKAVDVSDVSKAALYYAQMRAMEMVTEQVKALDPDHDAPIKGDGFVFVPGPKHDPSKLN